MKKRPRKNKKTAKKGGVKKHRPARKPKNRKKAGKIARKKARPVRKARPRKKAKPIKKRKPRFKTAKKRPRRKTKPIKRKKPKFKASKKRPRKRKPIKKRKKISRRRPRKIKFSKPRTYVGKGLLEQLFESQPKIKILKFFFRNYQENFTLKEVLRRLRTNAFLIRRELSKLEKLGLIRQRKVWLSFEKKRGGVRKEQKIVFGINVDFDFFNELKNLILKSTIASKDELMSKTKKIGNIKILALSGIFTGDETAKADILIVGDKINPRKLNTFIKDLEAEVGKELNCAAMTTREFNYRYDMYDRFVRDLLTGKSEILINRINLW